MSFLHPGVTEVRAEEASQMIDDGALLLDVREPFEYRDLRAPGAELRPMDSLPSAVSDLPKDRKVVVVCRSGNRSMHATRFLTHQGIDAVNLKGGMIAWSRAGLPTESG